MGHKYGFCSVALPLEDVIHKTLNFWKDHKGNIMTLIDSPNNLFFEIDVKMDKSSGSYGETYFMNIGYHPIDFTTYITIDVSLSSGHAMRWLTPLNIMLTYGRYIGTTTIKLKRKQNPNFIKKLNEIKNMPGTFFFK